MIWNDPWLFSTFAISISTFEHLDISADLQEQVSKEDEIEDGEDFSLTAKMKMVMGVCQTVQNSLDLVASYCERIKKYVISLYLLPSVVCCCHVHPLSCAAVKCHVHHPSHAPSVTCTIRHVHHPSRTPSVTWTIRHVQWPANICLFVPNLYQPVCRSQTTRGDIVTWSKKVRCLLMQWVNIRLWPAWIPSNATGYHAHFLICS